LQSALAQSAQKGRNVTSLTGFRAVKVEASADSVDVHFEQTSGAMRRSARGKLAVIADGGAIAQGLAHVQVREYGQSALVANVLTSRPHRNWAFERFTPEGPLALLPRDAGYALVWTSAPESTGLLCSLSPSAFLAHLQATFGQRAGTFDGVESRISFPLALRIAESPTVARTLLLGNAAQTLHPVAGQGLNLGLRDAHTLVDALSGHGAEPAALAAFNARRALDRRLTIGATDTLARLFTIDAGPLTALRGAALTALEFVPPLKTALARQMMFGQRR